MRIQDLLSSCMDFEWDDGNRDKNWSKHGVADAEAEQVFFNRPVLLLPDAQHSELE